MEKNLFCYPAMLNLHNKRCAVIGGGKVALRKTRSLIAAGALVTVIAPKADKALALLAAEKSIVLLERPYRQGDAGGCFLVVAATDSAALNRQIAAEAPCLVNVVTEPEAGNFSVPASSTSGRLTFTVFGAGLPAFSRLLARDMAKIYGDAFAGCADFLHEARQELQKLPVTPAWRTAFWRRLLDEDSIGMLHAGRLNTLKERITNAIDSFRAEP